MIKLGKDQAAKCILVCQRLYLFIHSNCLWFCSLQLLACQSVSDSFELDECWSLLALYSQLHICCNHLGSGAFSACGDRSSLCLQTITPRTSAILSAPFVPVVFHLHSQTTRFMKRSLQTSAS